MVARMTLGWILIASFAGGTLSAALAALALALNLGSSLATLVGGVGGYYLLPIFADWEASLLGFVAASMVYVAVADLIPGLHRRRQLRDTASQALLIALGIGSIAALRLLLAH